MKRLIAVTLALGLAAGALADNTIRIKNLRVLAAIYRGATDAEQRMDDHAVTMAKGGLELGRLFYFRNSLARLNVQFDWLVIDAAAPDNAGPTMEHMVADLRRRGVQDGDYDGLIVTGVGLTGNWGGFNVLGGAGGCFGIGGPRGPGYPGFDPDVGYGWAWIFAHEFQHALDLVIVEGSDLDMLHAHPYVDRTEEFFKGCYQGGEHWDWIAVTLREFDDYLKIKGVRNETFECVDADADGLPDDDPRLPADEKRFGSDATKKDTDGDGLDDLGEFTANRYAGSDPRRPDTDGDGLADSADPYPLVAISPTLPYYRAGEPLGLLLDSVFVRNDGRDDPVRVMGAWTEEELRLSFQGPRALTVHAKIDGSAANGFWEGGDTYVLRIAEDGVRFAGLGLAGDVPGARTIKASGHAHAAARVLGKLVAEANAAAYSLDVIIPTRIGQGVSKEINYGGTRDPEDVVDSLTLVAGRSVAFNFIVEFEDGTQAVLTPHHTMFATRLVKPADAPEHPILRAPDVTNAAVPVVEVLGVNPLTRVQIAKAGQAGLGGRPLGARIGPGPVYLVGLAADGSYDLVAHAGDAVSKPVTMTVDREAAAPTLAVRGRTVSARCEPGAAFELWWGIDGTPVAPVAGAQAGEDGQVALELAGDYLPGWVVTAFKGARFDEPVYVESWDKIDRHFQGGSPDPRLPNDGFSFRCEGLLKIDHPGGYTFELNTDDGSRLWIDDELVLDHWGHHGMSPRTGTVHLEARLYRLRIDYYEEYGWAGFKFRAGAVGGELTPDLPVRRAPLPVAELEFFGVQVDPRGNRSPFSGPAKM